MSTLTAGKRLTVFTIRNTERRGTIWTRIGTAFVNKDESLNIYLDALPIDGMLHCREAAADRGQGAGAQEPVGEPPARNGGHHPEAAAAGGGL